MTDPAQPDRVAWFRKMVEIRLFEEKVQELFMEGLIQGTTHDDGIIMAYLPKEKLLVEADVYTPAPPNTAPPATPNPNQVALHDNIERLKLSVDQILPLHGRKVSAADFRTWIGKGS